jgi:hypothetical protein
VDLQRVAVRLFCTHCPVRSECLLEALVTGDQGVRGGLTEPERRGLTKEIRDPDPGRLRRQPPSVRQGLAFVVKALELRERELCIRCARRPSLSHDRLCAGCAGSRTDQPRTRSVVAVDVAQDPAEVLRQLVVLAQAGERAVLRQDGNAVGAVVPMGDVELLAELESEVAQADEPGAGGRASA